MKHEIHVFGWLNYHELSNIPIFCNWFIHLITNILYYLAQKAPEFQGSLRVFGQVSWAPRSWFLFIAKWRKPCDLLVRSREDTGIIWETYARLSRIHDSLGANWHDLKKAFFCGKKYPVFGTPKWTNLILKQGFKQFEGIKEMVDMVDAPTIFCGSELSLSQTLPEVWQTA